MILGIVWSRQPCSPYVVLSRFRRSPSWRWSSSTGAIYPAIRRLKSRGLLDHRGANTGNRKSELLSLSSSGDAMLREWISNLTEEMGSAGADPICMRVAYLASLKPQARIQFIDRAEEVTQSRLELAREYRGDAEARQSWTFQASTLGLISLLEARLRWLQALRKIVDQQESALA